MASSSKKIQLIDAFLFYNELDMLKARLEYLGPLVNYFVICEADTDFSGRKKGFLLNQEVIQTLPFSNKIIFHPEVIQFNGIYWLLKKIRYFNKPARLLWKLQDAQRNALLKPLIEFENHDLVIFSDLDEFPSESAILFFQEKMEKTKEKKSNGPIFSCKQIFYYYDLHHAALNDIFYGSIMTNLGTLRSKMPHKIKSIKDQLNHIDDGGWHFSYFMSPEKIQEKVRAISDVEKLSQYKNIDTAEIQSKISRDVDLYDRKINLSADGKNRIPQRLFSILEKYLPKCL